MGRRGEETGQIRAYPGFLSLEPYIGGISHAQKDLLQALCAGSLLSMFKELCGAGNQTLVNCVPDKHFTCCTLCLSLIPSFLSCMTE